MLDDKKYAKTNKINYLLSGKVFCGECSSNLVCVSDISPNDGKPYGYYKPKCRCKTVKKLDKQMLEQYIAEEVKEHSLTDENIQIIANKVKELNNLLISLDLHLDGTPVLSRINGLEHSTTNPNSEIALSENLKPNINVDPFIFTLNSYKAFDLEYEPNVHKLINTFIDRVEFHKDSIHIFYNYYYQ